MARIGEINKLTVKQKSDDGAYLDGGESGDIVLSKKHVSKTCRPGDKLEVFAYTDKEGRLRATPQKPYATVGQVARLRVVSKSPFGAYLDWGLQKELLVPKREQQTPMEEGKSYIVYLFLDEKKRIAASSKLDKFLSGKPPAFLSGEAVDLLICEKNDMGYKAIVNNSHWGMLFKNEVFQKLVVGQQVKGYIKNIRDDLKIDLSLQPSGYEKVGDISTNILKVIKDFGGVIAFTDKSPPEDIYSLFGVSKKTFKKAIGALYKKRLITMDAKGIKLVSKPKA